jgi:AcrR family transcriptional regulator
MKSIRSQPSKARKAQPSKTQQSAPDTRKALMDSGLLHFGASGFQAASVHDIARDAGVNVSLVSYHFGGKEGLFKSCLERVGDDQLEVAMRVLAKQPASIDEVRIRLEMFVDEMLLYGITHPNIFTILYRDLNSEFHLIEEIFKKTFLKVFQLLCRFLETARDRELLSKWIDPQLSAMQFMGSVCHTLRTDHIREKIFKLSISDPETRQKTRDYIVRSHLYGLIERKAFMK